MRNLKVGNKLIVSFGTILILFIISIMVGLFNLNSVKVQLNQFYDAPYPVQAASLNLKANLEGQQKSVFRAIATTDTSILTPVLQQAESYGTAIQENLSVIKEKFAGDKQWVTDLANDIAEWDKIKTAALNMATDNSISSEEISKYMQENSIAVTTAVNDSLQKVIDFANQRGERLIQSTNKAEMSTMFLLITMCGASVLIGIALCIYITKSIVAPLVEIRKASNEMSQGKLDAQISYQSKDEIGQVSDSMRETLTTLSSYIRDIDHVMGELAGGNLNIQTTADFRGDFISIQKSIQNLTDSMNETLTQINQSADQVASGSDQVSNGSQALSQGAAEQASSVEELAATINEISSQVNKNATNALQASAKANSVGEEMISSNQQMQDMIQAMEEISSSSNEIGKIIKTIEDIAFQTNILALNAAVEAARAGAAGKGFAVVADEVRNLASKSAEASSSTASLIEGSLRAVEHGARIADATAKSMESVVEGAKEMAATVDRISEASKEQANSIMQVTQGVDRISDVVQTNSATSEESAAASEELNNQAQVLKGLVSRFRLKGISTSFQPDFDDQPEQPLFEMGSKY